MPLSTPVLVLLVILLGYLLPAIFLVRKRSWRAPDTVYLILGLGMSAVWFVSALPMGLGELVPTINWPRLEIFFFLALSVIFLEFTRAFLQQTQPSVFNWGLVIVGTVIIIVFEMGWVALPSFRYLIGTQEISNLTLVPLLHLSLIHI